MDLANCLSTFNKCDIFRHALGSYDFKNNSTDEDQNDLMYNHIFCIHLFFQNKSFSNKKSLK